MPKIVIVSPDPEGRKMFELALGLEGFDVEASLAVGACQGGTAAVLFDVVRDAPEEWREAKALVAGQGDRKGKKGGTKVAVILPRGMSKGEAPRWLKGADIVVGRPFELCAVVRDLKSAISAKG